MNVDEYAKMADFEQYYWWHKGKVSLLKVLIEKYFPQHATAKINILEVGCGTGEIAKLLSKYGEYTGFDISPHAVAFSKDRGFDNVVLGDINDMDLIKYENSFDLIVALDVLEHIQEDVETIKKIKYMLKPNGIFIANVPAHKFLWSEHDEALHHKRRYNSIELAKKVSDAGLKVLKESYFVSTAFAPIFVFRMWGSLFSRSPYPQTTYVVLPKPLNAFMTKVLDVEAKLIRKINLPIGVTLTIVAKKI